MDFILLNIIIMIGFVKVFIEKRSFINSTSLKLWLVKTGKRGIKVYKKQKAVPSNKKTRLTSQLRENNFN